MNPGRKCEEQQKERIYQSISSLFFLNEFECCSFLPDRINSNNSVGVWLSAVSVLASITSLMVTMFK